MRYIVTINNKNYEVEVEKGQASIVKTTEVASQSIPVVTTAIFLAPVNTAVPTSNGERLISPMPGTIIDIKVNIGEKVKKGNVILIMEAMKMENEIVASKDGVVVQIIVVKGSSVSTGDVLAVIA